MAEQAPFGTEPGLTAYLARMFDRIENRFVNAGKLPIQQVEVKKPVVGKTYYFASALNDDITEEGLYIYKSTGWVFIA